MEDSLRDLKQSRRALLIKPAFTLAALAALALGNGANTAVFTLVSTVLLKPLNAPGADRMPTLRLHRWTKPAPGGAQFNRVVWRFSLVLLGVGAQPRPLPNTSKLWLRRSGEVSSGSGSVVGKSISTLLPV